MEPNTLYMIQLSKYRWELRSAKGVVLQEYLSFRNAAQAEEYVKNYITSFQNWLYEMRPL